MKPYIGSVLLIALLTGCSGAGVAVEMSSETAGSGTQARVPSVKTYATAKEYATEAYGRVNIISVCEYDQMVQSGTPHVLFDVREEKEIEAGAYKNAISLPRGVLEFKISDLEKWKTVGADRVIPSKKEKIVVYCKSGLRSALVADNLQRLGFTDITIIRGGWDQLKKGLADEGSQPVKLERRPKKIEGQFASIEEMVAAAKAHCSMIPAGDVQDYLAMTPNVYLFDLRQLNEFEDGHVDGAILSPRGVFEFQVSMSKKWTKVKTDRPMPAKSDPMVIYCKKGSRSILASDALRSMGFTNIRCIEGGWLQYKVECM